MLYSIRAHCLFAIALVGSATTLVVAAETTPVANVSAEFEGGLVGADMASVIVGFFGKSRILPTKLVKPEQTLGLCAVLKTELNVAPEFCSAELIAAIQNINEQSGMRLNPNAINSKVGVILPDVRVTEKLVERVYNLENQVEADRVEGLIKNPAWGYVIQDKIDNLFAGLNTDGDGVPDILQLTIKRVTWQFDIKDRSTVSEALFVARQLSSRNLSVSVELTEGFEKVPHSPPSAAEQFKKWCGPPPARTSSEGDFSEMSGHLYDTSGVVSCDSNEQRPQVAIMDQPISAHPDLLGAFAVSPSSTVDHVALQDDCNSQEFISDRDHGMLLATIVASNKNNYGFVGMAPNAIILPFIWNRKSVKESELKEFIESAWKNDAPQVFLLASEFAPYPSLPGPDADPFERENAKATWQVNSEGQLIELLADDHVRIQRKLVGEIFHRKVFLVASAGQSPAGSTGREIYWDTPMSPQNLGDYESVLIVGACVRCDAQNADLWERSYRGRPESGVVSLLAPGGDDVPTYVTADGVGKTIGGTSAAAAFAAGLAAKMSACYPRVYGMQPENLKERMILSSRPVFGADRSWLDQIAGGILDPSVSMLDPRKTWLKLDSKKVEPVQFKHWCTRSLDLEDDDDGPRDALNLLKMRRLTSIGNQIVGQSVANVSDSSPSSWRKRIVRRTKPGVPAARSVPLAEVTYENGGQSCGVSLDTMTDFFLSKQSAAVGQCQSLPPCGDAP